MFEKKKNFSEFFFKILPAIAMCGIKASGK
jgi:hypothetical protein